MSIFGTPYRTPPAAQTSLSSMHAEQASSSQHSILSESTPQQSKRNCLRAFVISVIVIGAIALVTGVLALLASHGAAPQGLNSLSAIGEMNSYLMVIGGGILFGFSVVSFACLVQKEKNAESDAV